MPAPRRADRVARELQKELADLVRREVKDPRVQAVTFTRVECSPDLRSAKVFFVPLGKVGQEQAARELGEGLRKAAPFLQGRIGRKLRLRSTPRLTFLYDSGVENLLRIHDLSSKLVAATPEQADDPDQDDASAADDAADPAGDAPGAGS